MAEVMKFSSVKEEEGTVNSSLVVSNKKMMKFFIFDFVSCYRPSKTPPPPAAVQQLSPASSSFIFDEDTRTINPLSCAGGGDDNPSPFKKRGKVAVTRSNSISACHHWKPSLSAISEDKVDITVVMKKSSDQTVRSEKKVAGKSGSRARIRACDHRDNNNEYRRTSLTVVIPTFSPTAFLF